jgi:hypothetical protein
VGPDLETGEIMRRFINDSDTLEYDFCSKLRARLVCREEDKEEIVSDIRREIYEFIDHLDERIESLIEDLAINR